MPRIEQGRPQVRKVERRSKKIDELAAAHFQGVLDAIDDEKKNRRQTVELLEKILDKLEEIRYALVDNETGVSNMLRQMKISNQKLDELLDKRN